MQSTLVNPRPVSEFLQTELGAGRIIGPLPDIPEIQISRFGVIPKPGQPGKWRLILDLSSPHSWSILCSIRYTTVDNAVCRILSQGTNSLLAKIDVEHAYRNVPIHPSDRRLLGMTWEGKVFVDTVLATLRSKVCSQNFFCCCRYPRMDRTASRSDRTSSLLRRFFDNG